MGVTIEMHSIRYTAMLGAVIGVLVAGLSMTGDPIATAFGGLPAVVFAFGVVGEIHERFQSGGTIR